MLFNIFLMFCSLNRRVWFKPQCISFVLLLAITACSSEHADGEIELEEPQNESLQQNDIAGVEDQYELPSDWQTPAIASTQCQSTSLSGDLSKRYEESMSKLFVWLTGTAEQAEFEPIGEVANYFGFAAFRNEYRERLGPGADESLRGTLFVEFLELLDPQQRQVLYQEFEKHNDVFLAFLQKRLEFVRLIWDLKSSQPLNFDEVSELILQLGMLEGEITTITAAGYQQVLAVMAPTQMDYLQDIRLGVVSIDDMKNSSLTYADESKEQFDLLTSEEQDLMTEYATKFVSWVTGNVYDAVYLPSGKIGNYFGFAHYRYVDRANVSRSGAAAFAESVLTDEQTQVMCGLALQIADYTQDYIDGRERLIIDLYPLSEGLQVSNDDFYDSLINDYGQLAGVGEGRRVVIEALTFLTISNSFSDIQLQQISTLR